MQPCSPDCFSRLQEGDIIGSSSESCLHALSRGRLGSWPSACERLSIRSGGRRSNRRGRIIHDRSSTTACEPRVADGRRLLRVRICKAKKKREGQKPFPLFCVPTGIVRALARSNPGKATHHQTAFGGSVPARRASYSAVRLRLERRWVVEPRVAPWRRPKSYLAGQKKKRRAKTPSAFSCVPTGIRTRVAAVKGRCP